MSKEAMKLALEALENWLEFDPENFGEIDKKAITALREALANEALERMAENARELGLDYEPVWNNLPSNKDVEDAMRLKRLSRLAEQPAQQEPVNEGWKLVPVDPTKDMWKAVNKLDDEMAAGNYNGKGCSIEQAWHCLLDASPTPPAQRPWVGLVWGELPEDGHNHDFLRGAVWAEAKLRSKNENSN